jgi:hypothetical protein
MCLSGNGLVVGVKCLSGKVLLVGSYESFWSGVGDRKLHAFQVGVCWLAVMCHSGIGCGRQLCASLLGVSSRQLCAFQVVGGRQFCAFVVGDWWTAVMYLSCRGLVVGSYVPYW